MGKKLLLIIASFIFLISNMAFAVDSFDSLTDLTPEQRRQMSIVYNNYKVRYNELLNNILVYTDKVARAKLDSSKTPNEIALIVGAYERNIDTLKNQQRVLERETDSIYRMILTDNQYRQYHNMQANVQDAFSRFLQK